MEIRDVQFPLELPRGRLRRWAKVFLGSLLLVVQPARARALQSGEIDSAMYSATDRLLLTALVFRHQRRGTLDQLARVHERFWASDQITSFHTQAEARFQSWWVDHHARIVPMIQARLDARPGAYHHLVEIGCGSGLVLQDVAARLPSLDALVGLDLSAAQIELNRARFTDPRLSFDAADAEPWLRERLSPGGIVFTNAGVLEYFPRPKLESLLRAVAARAPSMCALVEPLDPDVDASGTAGSRPHGVEHSFSHPYLTYLREAGFTVRAHEDQVVDGQRFLLVVADTA